MEGSGLGIIEVIPKYFLEGRIKPKNASVIGVGLL
jgi:hypothetical protein